LEPEVLHPAKDDVITFLCCVVVWWRS